jgi:valyl-tRNA synthetase
MTDTLSQPGLNSLAKSFEPASIEARWAPEWERQGYARAGYRGTGKSLPSAPAFAIQLPPPNVTGTLHMGHAFNQTIMDALTRYHRMLGNNTVWIPGTDHAGIATQIVVERQLQEQGLNRHVLGRSKFIQRVWDWRAQSGHTITTQMRRMGDSVDWSREYFTMDDQLSKVVTQTFVTLFQQGLIYRGKRLVNFDPVLKSAVSDLEVESEEEDGSLWHIRYPLLDPDGRLQALGLDHLVVATTRPETMLGDVAVMVHPEDERYKALIGAMVRLPLSANSESGWRNIPVIADDYVDPSFGTGVVKVTPAHDVNDYAVGQRHGLPLICVLNLDATLSQAAPSAYQGLDRFAARTQIVRDLQALGLMADIKKHKLMVPRCSRTGQVVEPMLTDQWFVAMNKVSPLDPSGTSISQKAVEAVSSGQVQFVPENWVNTYNQWMNNIQDWCISRQLWWGHQIPAWYAKDGQVFVACTEAQAQAAAQAAGCTGALTRDEDVLDTWFSSALVPFSTLGWPDQQDKRSDFELYLPSSVLVTGYDIIFFWVARMIMMTTHFTGQVPFRHVYIHGLVRDAQGQKMSKSEGNVLDPVDLIDGIDLAPLLTKRTNGLRKPETAPQVRKNTEKEFPDGIPAFGADALRFTFASLASLGRNINFDTKRCEGYRNFCNKLWNATRFVLMHCEGQDCGLDDHAPSELPADRWIVSLLQETEAAVAKGFSEYRLDTVAQCVYDFVWNEFCDWYLEIAKVQLIQGSAEQQRQTRCTLIQVLETVLRLAHPIIPFITEELWQKVAPVAGKTGPSISVAPYPVSQPGRIDTQAVQTIHQLKLCVDACRNLRGQMSVSPSTRLPMYVLSSAQDLVFFETWSAVLQSLAKLSEVQLFEDARRWTIASQSAPLAVVGEARLCLFMKVDIESEKTRLGKEASRLQGEIAKAQGKLGNHAFVAKAPAAVIEQEQQRLADFSATLLKVQSQLELLNAPAS